MCHACRVRPWGRRRSNVWSLLRGSSRLLAVGPLVGQHPTASSQVPPPLRDCCFGCVCVCVQYSFASVVSSRASFGRNLCFPFCLWRFLVTRCHKFSLQSRVATKRISNFVLFLSQYLKIYFGHGSLGSKKVTEVNIDRAHLIMGTPGWEGTLGRMEHTQGVCSTWQDYLFW